MMDKIRTGWQREFFQVPNEIYDRRDISGYAKAVFVYLCRRADDESKAFPTYGRIAADVGFSISTVRRAIEILTETGLLIKEARFDGRGFQTSNLYTLIRPSSVPEQGQASLLKERVPGDAEPVITEVSETAQGVLREQSGCSERAGRVLSENSPVVLSELAGCSVGTARMFCENNKKDPRHKDPEKEYPNEKYPGEKNQSVRQSIKLADKVLKEGGQTGKRTDFTDYEQVVNHYMDRFGAARDQVVKAMVSVQAQLDNGTVILDCKAYFEKTLTQLMQEDDLRKHFG